MRISFFAPAAGAALAIVMAVDPLHSVTTPPVQPSAWHSLFDGKSISAWRGYKSDTIPKGWRIADGTLTKDLPTGDLVSKEEFGDFELELEWKVASGGNSGIFYRGTEDFEHIYWTAPEMQILDDEKAPDGRDRLTSAGAAYGLYAAPAGIVKPAGQWNAVRIIAKGPHVEHWLNGKKVVSYELMSPDWEAKVKASKFSAWPKYGRIKKGHLALQGDHDGALAFRNIRIRTL